MTYQRIHKPSSWNPPSQAKSAHRAGHPVAIQAAQDLPRLPAPEGINKFEAVEHDEFGVSGDRKAQRLGGMARFSHRIADILVRPADKPVPAPAQSELSIQAYRANEPLHAAHGQGESATNVMALQAQSADARQENRTGIPVPLKEGLEQLSGFDLSDVRVHYNSAKPAQLNALAYTQGQNIEVGPGQERHLPHEGWHVVQQKQGRVRATMQTRGASINDDPALEREADRMGERAVTQRLPDPYPALQRRSGASAGRIARYSSNQATDNLITMKAPDGPVQRIISLATFQAATPKTLGHDRGPNLLAVDADLGAYIGARTQANAATLNVRCVAYLGGIHQPGRVAAVTALRDEIQRERNLLMHIGNANAHLIDALIAQVGGAPGVPALVSLAAQVGQANANVLPSLIATVTPANLAALVASGIIPAIGGAEAYLLNQLIPLAGGVGGIAALTALVNAAAHHNLDLLPSMVRDSGGAAQVANLTALINRVGKTTADIFDLAREAGMNAATFQRFHDDVIACTSTAAPAMLPAPVQAARDAYNLAKNIHFDAIDNGVIVAIMAHVIAMRTAATQMVASAGLMGGAPAALMANVAPLMADMNTHHAGLLAGLPLAFTFQDVRNNIATLSVLLNGIRGWANGQPPSVNRTSVLNEHPNFTAARALFDGVAFPAAARARNVTQIDFAHFFERHTRPHFDFTDIKPQNTMWPSAWDPIPLANVTLALIHGFGVLAAGNRWFHGGVPENGVATGFAPTMRMIAYNMDNGITLRLGMVHPEANPGVGVYDYTGNQMRAIHKAI